jgi:hypothetical protein
MKIMLWIVAIEHKHGTDLHAASTMDKADAIVRAYVDEWWEHEMEETPKPEDPDQMVEEYFDAMDDESYMIQEANLEMEPVHD